MPFISYFLSYNHHCFCLLIVFINMIRKNLIFWHLCIINIPNDLGYIVKIVDFFTDRHQQTLVNRAWNYNEILSNISTAPFNLLLLVRTYIGGYAPERSSKTSSPPLPIISLKTSSILQNELSSISSMLFFT